MHRVFSTAAAVIPILVASAAVAQLEDEFAILGITSTAPSYGGCDAGAGIDDLTCIDLASGPFSGAAFLWVVATRWDGIAGPYPNGIGGVQFGIEHSFGDVDWTVCTGGLEIPLMDWPASGSGNAVIWEGKCYVPAGINAKVGFISVDDASTGSFGTIDDPRIENAIYVDCAFDPQIAFERLMFDGDVGDGIDPDCPVVDPIPTVQRRWSELKSSF